jgi:hypothetical protein
MRSETILVPLGITGQKGDGMNGSSEELGAEACDGV